MNIKIYISLIFVILLVGTVSASTAHLFTNITDDSLFNITSAGNSYFVKSLFGGGDVSSPTYSWFGDSDSGMFLIGDGTIGWGIAGSTEALLNAISLNVSSASDVCITGGNCLSSVGGGGLWATNGTSIYNATVSQVGIGTTSPGAKLDVNGNILIQDNGYLGSASDTDAIKIGSGGDVTFTSTRVGTSEGSYNSIIGSAFAAKTGFTYNNIVGQSIANSATGSVNYNSITGYTIANSATGSVTLNSITGYTIANSATGDVYRNSLTGTSIANSATGDVRYNSITGYTIANSATGSVNYNSLTGTSIANSATGDVTYSFSTGKYNLYNTANATNLNRVIALPYEALRESSASDLTDAIAIGYRAGYQNAYNSPMLLGREATAGANNQIVIGSSFYTGGTALMGGNVGIGTATPTHLLSVIGADGTSGGPPTSAPYILNVTAGRGGDGIAGGGANGGGMYFFGGDGGDAVPFSATSGGAGGDIFLIAGNGGTGDIVGANGALIVGGNLEGESCAVAKESSFLSEESGELTAGSYQFSFGNGDINVGLAQPCAGKLTAMTVSCETCTTTTSTVEVRIDTTGTNCETDIDTAGGMSANDYYGSDASCSDTFSAGDNLRCYTIDDAGTCQGCVCAMWVQYD